MDRALPTHPSLKVSPIRFSNPNLLLPSLYFSSGSVCPYRGVLGVSSSFRRLLESLLRLLGLKPHLLLPSLYFSDMGIHSFVFGFCVQMKILVQPSTKANLLSSSLYFSMVPTLKEEWVTCCMCFATPAGPWKYVGAWRMTPCPH